MASCFSLQLAAHAASPVQSHACPSVGRVSSQLPRNFASVFYFIGFSICLRSPHCVSVSPYATFLVTHIHKLTHMHLLLSMQPFCSMSMLTFAVHFSFTSLKKTFCLLWFKAQLVLRLWASAVRLSITRGFFYWGSNMFQVQVACVHSRNVVHCSLLPVGL